jgi:hypothetical protein
VVNEHRSFKFALLASIGFDGSQHDAGSQGYSESPILAVLLLLGASMKSDSDIKKDVHEELLWDPLVPEARVGVAVKDGIVTLTGHLDTYAEKVAVKRAVERVSGVKAIAVELDVIPLGVHKHSDTEIAAAVEHALSWNTSVPQGRVRVVVEKGWGHFERRA